MITSLMKLYALIHNTTLVQGIVDQGYDAGIEHLMARSDGHIELGHVSIAEQKPKLRFTTEDIAAALDLVGLGGLAVSASAGAGTKMYFRSATQGGGNVASATTSHQQLEMLAGMLIGQEITAEQGPQAARMTLQAVPRFDGTNAPIVVTGSKALEGSPSAGNGARFTVGPLLLHGVQVPGVKSFRCNFGLELFEETSDGEIYPTWVGVRTRQLELSWRVLADVLTSLGINGVVQDETSSVAFLRKKELGGGLVADDTAEHISFTMADGAGRIFVREKVASGPDGAQSEIVWQPYSVDGATAPLTVDTTAAISED